MKKILGLFFLTMFRFSQIVFSQENLEQQPSPQLNEVENSSQQNAENKTNLVTDSFSIVLEGAFHPKTTKIPGGTHFAPITAPYGAIEMRATGVYNYVIPLPFSQHPLVKDNTLTLSTALELSPITFAPKFDIAFSPIAFLVFSAGAKIGTGWNLDALSLKGLAVFDKEKNDYISVTPFASYTHQWYLEGLFQFDLAAILPGKWNHIVTQARYKFLYEGLWNAGDPHDFWRWQGTIEKVSGWQYLSSIVVGYQMPLVLQMVALQFEFEGYFDKHDFPDWSQPWNPKFMKVGISPVLAFKFNDKHSVMLQFRFRNRRSFTTEIQEKDPDFYYEYAGTEWFFERIGLNYTIKL